MPNQWFRFKQFTVWQDKTAMKVGTDGVLLGAWTNCEGAKTALDIGTGTGLISLMLAQRYPSLSILSIDVDMKSVYQAEENFNKSPWSNRLTAQHISLQDFVDSNDKKYDVIVSNPPYFENSLRASTNQRSLARHTISLNYNDLIESSARLLDTGGRLSVILPYPSNDKFIELAQMKQFFCIRRLFVKPKKSMGVIRVLLELGFNKEPITEDTLVIENTERHDYTNAYKELTKGFYLKF